MAAVSLDDWHNSEESIQPCLCAHHPKSDVDKICTKYKMANCFYCHGEKCPSGEEHASFPLAELGEGMLVKLHHVTETIDRMRYKLQESLKLTDTSLAKLVEQRDQALIQIKERSEEQVKAIERLYAAMEDNLVSVVEGNMKLMNKHREETNDQIMQLNAVADRVKELTQCHPVNGIIKFNTLMEEVQALLTRKTSTVALLNHRLVSVGQRREMELALRISSHRPTSRAKTKNKQGAFSAFSAGTITSSDPLSVIQPISRSAASLCITHLTKLSNGRYFCVIHRPDGSLLVGREGSVEIRQAGGALVSSVSTPGCWVTGACELQGRIYLLLTQGLRGTKRRVSVRESKGFKELFSWPLSDCPGLYTNNMATLGETLLLPSNYCLDMYNAEGQRLTTNGEIGGKPIYLCTSGTTVVVSHCTKDVVAAYDSCRSYAFYNRLFSYHLKSPTAVAVAVDGSIYVPSLADGLHILTADGQLIAELHHQLLKGCVGVNITEDKLLVATSRGLHLFQLG